MDTTAGTQPVDASAFVQFDLSAEYTYDCLKKWGLVTLFKLWCNGQRDFDVGRAMNSGHNNDNNRQ